MRWLVAAVVVMGVLIVGATGVLVATLVARFHVPGRAGASASVVVGRMPVSAGQPAAAIRLDEPTGTRIAAASASGDRLVLTLRGGGPDRVVVLDTANGRIGLRVALSR
ncbi:MAG TPA: hypothetical protein VHY76_12385 [Acetobacteraceae bacterium]|nr:hypothetical protein [Acetobacteraceae bacterium]